MQLKKSLAISVLMASLTLAGCANVVADYQSPLEATSLVSSSITEHNVDIAAQQLQWWKNFDDQDLDQLIALTLKQNPSLKIARANVDAAYAVFRDTDNNNSIQGDVGASYTAQDQAVPGLSDQRVNTRTYRAGADLRWSLDLFNKLEYAARAAKANAKQQEYAWQEVKVNLIAQTTALFGELKALQARTLVAQQNVQSLTKTEAVIQARLDAGFSSELDLLRIQSQVKGVEASIPGLKAQQARVTNTLLALAGLSPNDRSLSLFSDEAFSLKSNIRSLSIKRPIAIGTSQALLKRRPDVYAAERQLAAANSQLGFETASLYPDISVSGFVGFLSGDIANLGNQTKAWSIAPSISWPAFDLDSVDARIDTADANIKAAAAQFERTVLDALNEAQTALQVYTQSQKQLNLLEMQVDASEKALNLAQLQYDAGSIDLLVLLDAERSVLAAKDNLAQTQAIVFSNIIEIYRAFGGNLISPDSIETERSLLVAHF
ncbi:MAG: TolC family protein [Aliiglaciecola sp.]